MSNKEPENANPFEGFTSAGFLDGAPVEPPKDESTPGDGGDDDGDSDDGNDSDADGSVADDADSTVDSDERAAPDARDQDEEAKEPAKTKPKKTAQERIGEITHARREAERRADAERTRADAAEARAAALERGDTKQPLTKQPEAAKDDKDRPKPDAYEYGELDGKYIADVTAYEVNKAIATHTAKQEETRQAEAAAVKQREYQKRAGDMLEAGRAKFEDFDDQVLEGTVITKELTGVIHDLLLESEVGADIVYHLATHPKEARAIFSKSAIAQAADFGRLEARFTAPPKAEKKPDPKPPSAPDPVKQPRGAGGKFATAPETSDFAAFEALANR